MAGVKKEEDSTDANDISSIPSHKPKRPGFFRWILSLTLRLLIWYSLLSPFIYCPSNLSDLGPDSPRLCKPYLAARSRIGSHISPYYETYAAPYVDVSRPYIQAFNERVYEPTSNFAQHSYQKYGASRLDSALVYAQGQWDTIVTPRLQAVQQSVVDKYESSVAPPITQAVTKMSPYYYDTRDNFVHLQKTYILPVYLKSKPAMERGYVVVHDLVVNKAGPFALKAWTQILLFVNDWFLPQISGLYKQNIEPQLVRIGEKLASYREGKKLRTIVEENHSSTANGASSSPSSQNTIESEPTSQSTPTKPAPPETPLSESEKIEKARNQIASDLKTWQEKFALAADKGADDLEENVADIVRDALDGGLEKGKTLVSTLESTASNELESLKQKVVEIVGSLPDDTKPEDTEAAISQFFQDVRSSGFAIRDSAHGLRQWFNEFESGLSSRVNAAADSTLDVLDNIRGLGLQEIGMRWAWMDGVTYKDWAKYHALKQQLSSWRDEVRDVALQHKALLEARDVVNELVANGMSIAESAAADLLKIKEIGKWKIEAEDASDNFEVQDTDPAVARASKRAAMGLDQAEDSPTGEEQTEAPADDTQPEEPTEAPEPKSSETVIMAQVSGEDQDAPIPTVNSAAGYSNSPDDGNSFPAPEGSGEESTILLSHMPNPSVGSDSPGEANVLGGAAAVNNEPDKADKEPSSIPDPTAVSSHLAEVSSTASSKLKEQLEHASAVYENVLAAATEAAAPDQHPIVLDAERRYHEALDRAHKEYSASLKSASSAEQSQTSAPQPSITSNAQDRLESVKSEYGTALSLASASLDAVVYSVSSAQTTMNTDSARSILEEAFSRYDDALSAASSSLLSASSEAAATMTSSSDSSSTSADFVIQENIDENIDAVVDSVGEQLQAVLESVDTKADSKTPDESQDAEDMVIEKAHDEIDNIAEFMKQALSATVSEAEAPTSVVESASSRLEADVQSAHASLRAKSSTVDEETGTSHSPTDVPTNEEQS